ncbi:MAG: hypothetical protein A3G87_00770 [Omnitrophica bacterium RIFCSPLOWO2_12_FULL_50_11]|nr:MAG: hypothetical protein A3G87_00770 [Omnitrophica bacterium RIFCSPLOWO2_12_FULL_50_11]
MCFLFIASGVLLIVSVLVPFLNWLIWFAFVPALVLIRRLRLIPSFVTGTGLGLFYFSAYLYSLVYYEVRIFAIVLLLAAPLIGVFLSLTRAIWQKTRNHFVRLIAPPLAWSAVSFLYSFTPIGIIGDQISLSQAPHFPLIAYVTGVSGIAVLIVLGNSVLYHWFYLRKGVFRSGLIPLLLITTLGVTQAPQPPKQESLKVALIQHNFPIETQWRYLNRNDLFTTYEEAIKHYGPLVDLVVFPQYGLPKDVLRESEWLVTLAQQNRTSILLGTYLPKESGGNFVEGERTNSALLFTPDGHVQEYQAVTAPPFREIGQVLGTEHNPLVIDEIPIGVMLCYEDVDPRQGKKWVEHEAQLLFALSNPGHFLKTRLPNYHLLHDQIRAIETGRFLIRVSPNGFSAVIDPNGRIITQSRLDERRVLVADVYPISTKTLFARVGSILPGMSALVVLALVIRSYVRDRIRRRARKKR